MVGVSRFDGFSMRELALLSTAALEEQIRLTESDTTVKGSFDIVILNNLVTEIDAYRVEKTKDLVRFWNGNVG